MNKILSERKFSGFPLSIGTGLSMESIFEPIQAVYDETRKVPNKINTSDYSLYVFNISTLLRNLINSISYENLILVSKKNIYDALLDEIEFITYFFTTNDLYVKFYVNNYQFVKNHYEKEGKLRKSTTEKQLFISSIFNYCLDRLKKEDDVDSFSNDIKYSKQERVLLFTHIPWDLLSYKNFVKLDLLESNTGIIKTRKEFNTKYFKIPDKDMSILPFIEYLLVKFGDNVMFHPSPLKERVEIYESMVRKKVHPLMDELSFSFLKI